MFYLSYVFGQLNSDEEYYGRSLAYSVKNGAKDILKQAREISAVLQELSGSFSGTLKAHMARLNVTCGKLAEESMLSDSTIKRMRTGDHDLQLDYLDNDLNALAQEEQREAMQTDEREGLVQEYLDKLLPEDWETMDLAERRGFLRGNAFTGGNRVGTVRRNTVCVLEIWCECLGRESGAIRRSDSNDIFSMLARIGWKKSDVNDKGTRRLSLYGPQRCFDRADAR